MRWVGERLDVFGEGRVAPDLALSTDSRLRRALFDILLSLVEGGVADIRRSENGYEFRGRTDDEAAWLAPAGPAIDLTAPAPWSGEFRRVCDERDDALRRAAVAEAVAAERERLLELCFNAMKSGGSTSSPARTRGDHPTEAVDSPVTRAPRVADAHPPPRDASVEDPPVEATWTWPRVVGSIVLVLVAALMTVAAVLYVTHRPPTLGLLPETLSRSHNRENVTAAVTFALAIIALATTRLVLRPAARETTRHETRSA
jgi:hypothetical protein